LSREGNKMKLKSNLLGVIVLAVLFGGIALTTALNLWTTENAGQI